MESTVTGVFGRRGACKTLTVTILGYAWLFGPVCSRCGAAWNVPAPGGKLIIPRMKNILERPDPTDYPMCPVCKRRRLTHFDKMGARLLTNYNHAFAHYRDEELVTWMGTFPDELNTALVIVDEQQGQASSMAAISRHNRLYNHLVEQIRKRRVSILYTAQVIGRVDSGVRFQTDIGVKVSTINKGRSILTKWWDQWGQWVPDEYGEVRNGAFPPTEFADVTLGIPGAARYWPLYNTNEVVVPTLARRALKKADTAPAPAKVIDESTPAGKAKAMKIDVLFSDIPVGGAPYHSLVMAFAGHDLPGSNLEYEIDRRGFVVEERGSQQWVTKGS